MRSVVPLVCAALLAAAIADGHPAGPGARIRATDDVARQLLSIGELDSPTVRQLLWELEATDLIILVGVGPGQSEWGEPRRRYHASTRLIAAAGGQRYIGIWLDSRWRSDGPSGHRVALLAHELQHALEVARNADVVDQGGMIALFSRIGREWAPRCFETDEAQNVEARVERELALAGRAEPQPSAWLSSRAAR